MVMRAAIYCRVSTDGQRDNYSIPSQLQDCREYAQQKQYAVVADRYVDLETGRDVSSGTNGAVPAFVDDYTSRELSRPSLDAALSFLEDTGFDILVVHALDRLARDPYIRQTLEIEFEQRGASVEYVQGNYDSSPEGEVRKDLDATFAKWENARRLERCNRGRKRKAESGLFVSGRAPYGYRIDKTVPGGLAVVERQAQVVRRVFRLYVEEGKSTREIARILSADPSATSYAGNDNWGASTIRRMLRNTTYRGVCYFNKWERRRNGRQLVMRDQSEWIEIETVPIIDPDVFGKAQRRLNKTRQQLRRRPKRFYLLSGLVLCAECGRPYASGTAKAGRNRRCNDAPHYRHRLSQGHCMNRMISARILEPQVWNEVVSILLDPENLQQGYEAAQEQSAGVLARHHRHLETLRRNRLKLERAMRNLTQAYIDPDIGMAKTEYLEQKGKIESDLRTVASEIAAVELELSHMPTPSELEEIEAFLAEVRQALGKEVALSKREKRKILEMLEIQVLISGDGSVSLEGWFTSSTGFQLP